MQFVRSFNIKLALMVLLSAVCAAVVWCSFVMPHEELEVREMLAVPAGVPPEAVVERKESPVLFQMQFLPWNQAFLADKERGVRGVALGYYLQQKEIDGLSFAFMHAANQRKSGLSMSVIELCGESSGLSFFVAGGAVKNRGCSIGLWNMTESNDGVQVGLINQSHKNALVDYEMKPEKNDSNFGVQAGLVNYSEGKGIQFGLWNTNPNGFLKHFPLINISW